MGAGFKCVTAKDRLPHKPLTWLCVDTTTAMGGGEGGGEGLTCKDPAIHNSGSGSFSIGAGAEGGKIR